MKKLISVFALLGMVAGASTAFAQEQGNPQPLQVGRYQMLDAPFTNSADAAMKQFRRLAILDTATGALTICDYSYRDVKKDGRELLETNTSCAPFVTDQPSYYEKTPKKK